MTKGIRAARKQARPREILEAAFEEFAVRGYSATSVDHIAARAGVTKGTIYVYFSNKEDVFEKMIAELAQPKLDPSRYIAELGKTKSINLLVDLFKEIYSVIIDDYYSREILRFLIAEANSFSELRRKNRENYALPLLSTIEAIVRYGCEAGEFRKEAADIDPLVLISPIVAINVMRHVDPELAIASPRFIEQHLSMVQHFLMA